MNISIKTKDGISCAVVQSEQVIINDVQSALDFITTLSYQNGCDRVALNKGAIEERFFILSSGLAGEILQKFSNYRLKFAIIGDFSGYTSKPLKDFMYECNKGKSVFFAASEEQAVEYLLNA